MDDTVSRKTKPGFKLAVAALLLALCVVILGAFTRLVDAGLGCPDWPVCYGHVLWPMDEEEVLKANAAFPDTPVDHAKTWPEQVHRLFASSLGVFCIALLIVAGRQRVQQRDQSMPFKLCIFLLALVILQGLFGMWTVTLKLWPQVVTAHLLGGFLTLSTIWLLCLRLYHRHWTLRPEHMRSIQSIKPFLWLATVILLLQIFLGGWTTSNYAALACPDFPRCQNQWLPTMNFAKGFNFSQAIGPNYLGGVMESSARTAIHFSHRLGAVLVTLAILLLAWRMSAIPASVRQHWRKLLLGLLCLQLILGISNVVWSLPLAVAVSHNAVGALLLLTLVGLSHRVYTANVAASTTV